MLLRKAVELVRGQPPEVDSGLLADKLTQYAQLLAAQGSLHTAINYLTESTQVREQTPLFDQFELIFSGYIITLLCKANRQYLLTLQVSRYCLLALPHITLQFCNQTLYCKPEYMRCETCGGKENVAEIDEIIYGGYLVNHIFCQILL